MRKNTQMKDLKRRVWTLLNNRFFWVLTLAGNSLILTGSLLLWFFESNGQENSIQYIDCLLWSVGTVTTIGYGAVEPATLPGKITLLFLMLSGTLFVWSYMAYLVTGLVAPDIEALEHEVRDFEKEVRNLRFQSNILKE